MTGSERAALRSQANDLQPVVQIGKGGVTQAVKDSYMKVLSARELIKIKVLESSGITAREAADILSAFSGAEEIQAIGSVAVLYKYNPELHKKK